jgi:hypothetical protein
VVVSAAPLHVGGGLQLGLDANQYVEDPRAWTNVVSHHQSSILSVVREGRSAARGDPAPGAA